MIHRQKCNWLIGMWLFLVLVPANGGAAEHSRDLYYSVHIDTAGNIEEVNHKINRLKVKEKIVFWQKRDVKGVGTYYKVYLGWFDDFKPARRFMRQLQAAGWKKSLSVHWFKYPPWEEQKAAAGNDKTGPVDMLPPPPPQVAMVDRFTDHGDGTVTDRRTGLMWIKNGWRMEFLAAVTWQKAMDACAVFRAGGHSDWRLPTVDEWKSLVDRSVSYPAMVEPNPFANIISHMPYWSRNEYAYSGRHPSGGVGARDSYTIMLYSGRFNHQRKTERAFVLPVRTAAKD